MTKKPVGLKDFKIEMVAIDQLKPYPNNAKAHPEAQIAKIARSIKEYGVCKNIVINADNVILAGHGSVLAYQKLGVGVVPCYRAAHLTPAQEMAFRIADNKSAESEWFPEALALELKALEEMDFDLGLTGFDKDELEAIGIGQSGEGGPEAPGPGKGNLSDRFGIPPFSVLNAREGWWQDRKRAWLALGIQSELGRGGAAFQQTSEREIAILKRTGDYGNRGGAKPDLG
jgi:hypothetical protein